MSVSISCSWCHTVNDSHTRWCKSCGHSAWHCRLDCDCRRCMGVLFFVAPPTRVEPEVLPLPRPVRRLLGDAFDDDDLADDGEEDTTRG